MNKFISITFLTAQVSITVINNVINTALTTIIYISVNYKRYQLKKRLLKKCRLFEIWQKDVMILGIRMKKVVKLAFQV